MKNRLLGMVMTGIIVSAFLVVLPACSDPQDVHVVPDKASQVSNVTAYLSNTGLGTNARVVTISWEAASNASNYYLYAQVDGNKSLITLGSTSSSYSNSNPYSGSDYWSYTYTLPSQTATTSFPSGQVRFGVQTVSIYSHIQHSDIKWSDPVFISGWTY